MSHTPTPEVEAQIGEAWKRADVALTVSCYCRTGEFVKK